MGGWGRRRWKSPRAAGGGYAVTLHPAPEQVCAIAPDVREAMYRYNAELLRQALEAGNEDMDGPYPRLAEKAPARGAAAGEPGGERRDRGAALRFFRS